MSITREQMLQSKDQYGKVDIGTHFVYGQVIDVHSAGDYFLFQRGAVGTFKPKWYHRDKLDLHRANDNVANPA